MKISCTSIVSRFAYSRPAGALIASKELAGLGNRKSIEKALCRLVKTGFLERIERGVYRRTSLDNLEVSIDEFVEFKQGLLGHTIVSLGTTQHQAIKDRFNCDDGIFQGAALYGTSGATSALSFKGQKIKLQTMGKRKVALGESPEGRLTRDAWALGRKTQASASLANAKKLTPYTFRKLRQQCVSLPDWLQSILED